MSGYDIDPSRQPGRLAFGVGILLAIAIGIVMALSLISVFG